MLNINAASIIAGSRAATTRDLLIAVNDAKLDVTSRNRDEVLTGLIRTAQANGRTDVARTLGRIAVDQRANVADRLAALALELHREEAPQERTESPLAGLRTDADVARDEQTREHAAAAQDEAAEDARDAEVDLLNALDAYARRALGIMGATDPELIAALDAATTALREARA